MMRSSIQNRRGFTLVEMMVATGIMTFMMACALAMWTSTVRRCETDMAQTDTDVSAVMAMQRMVGDIREAETVSIAQPGPSSGSQLCITMPVRVSQTQGSYYDRSTLDTAHPIYYYLSDSTGTMGLTGSTCTWLWRKQYKADGTIQTTSIRRNVDPQGLTFESDLFDPTHIDSVQITIRTKDTVSHEAMKTNIDTVGVSTQLTDRVVYLRNYQGH